jgi:DNA adenine methylase
MTSPKGCGHINSFTPYVGGKMKLRVPIFARFPPVIERYIEVFGGGGWILFYKPPSKFEVYNDFNPNLTNLFRCVRDYSEELIGQLEFTLNSRLDFNHIRQEMKKAVELPDIKRAAYMYQMLRQSYAAGLDSFGAQPRSMWNTFPLIRSACGRLQGVVIENKDFEAIIKQYDRPESFFYLDPPYFQAEGVYQGETFTWDDHLRLAKALLSIQGKFLLSYNDCPEIRELYKKPGIEIESISRLNNIAQRYDSGCMYDELLIANYDTTEKSRQFMQLTLFDDYEDSQQILRERKIIYHG